MKLVADWQLGRMPATPQTDWTWAALYTGFMGVPDAVAGDKYKKAMQDVGDKLNWQPGPRVEHADDQAVGQMYLEQYFIHKDARMLDPMKARLDQEIATPDDPAKPLWWWCDALFMAPPVFADMAKATGDKKYLDFMDREWNITTELLYDKNKHLYSRDAIVPRQAREERREAFLVPRQRLGHGRHRPRLEATAQELSAAAQVCGAAQGDVRRSSGHSKQGRPLASRPARRRLLSTA